MTFILADSHQIALFTPKITLLPYQRDICEGLDACIAAGQRRPLVVVRTAGGKTMIAVEKIRQALARGEEVLIVVHTEELIKQISEKLLAYDPALADFGFIKAGRPTRLLAKIQLASVQTLDARFFRSRKIDLLGRDLTKDEAASNDAYERRQASAQALADRPGTDAEGNAARAAVERLRLASGAYEGSG
jgi:superfamily II DNA or RNA helicase